MRPPATLIPKGWRSSAPAPIPNAIGRAPMRAAMVVIIMGRKRKIHASLIACSKNEGTTAPLSIVGKWEFVNNKQKTTMNGQITRDTTITIAPGEVIEFLSNGTGIWSGSNYYIFTYAFSGKTLTMISFNTKDTLVFNNSNFTATTLKLGQFDSFVENGYTFVVDDSYNLKRL